MTSGDLARILREVAALGPYYDLPTAPPEPARPPAAGGAGEPAGEAWRAFPERDPGRLGELIEDHGRRLGTGEPRVAASILFQGLAARLWSPVLAAASYGAVPDLAALQWRPGPPIAFRLARLVPLTGPDPARLAHRTVVDGALRALRETTLRVVRVSDAVLWGNAASALAGALIVPRAAGSGRAVPMESLARRILAMDPLADTGTLAAGGAFTRRSCCLYYRVPPGGGLCGDCVLNRPAAAR